MTAFKGVVLILLLTIQITQSMTLSSPGASSSNNFMPFGIHFGRHGLGACPKVKPMKDFDITKIYGGKWYLIAHYLTGYGRHCMEVEYSDVNEGKESCRVSISNNSTLYDDGGIVEMHYEKLLPDPAQPSVMIDDALHSPVSSIVLDTDYNDYLIWHECLHFPRDYPLFYEQHNYILSRKAVWKDPKTQLKKAFDLYKSFGIQDAFVPMRQDDCNRAE